MAGCSHVHSPPCHAVSHAMYGHLFGQHARTMLQFIWQTDLHGVASFIADCLDVYHITDPEGGQASDQP